MSGTLNELVRRCKCGVHVTFNEHRDYYQTAAVYIAELLDHEAPPTISPDVMEKMILADTIVQVQFYPQTPIGFYVVYHYDLDAALAECLTVFA